MEGHTDSRGYTATDSYSNWELSADRANAARRVMERSGLRPEQVTSVRGLADRQLRFPEDPFDARNRRVSILVKSPVLMSKPEPAAPETKTPEPLAANTAPAGSRRRHTTNRVRSPRHPYKFCPLKPATFAFISL